MKKNSIAQKISSLLKPLMKIDAPRLHSEICSFVSEVRKNQKCFDEVKYDNFLQQLQIVMKEQNQNQSIKKGTTIMATKKSNRTATAKSSISTDAKSKTPAKAKGEIVVNNMKVSKKKEVKTKTEKATKNVKEKVVKKGFESLQVGDIFMSVEGIRAEVLEVAKNGKTIKGRYIDTLTFYPDEFVKMSK